MDKLDLIKMKNFSSVKDPLKRMKGQSWDWEKIFANHLSDKGQYIYKEPPKFNSKKKKKGTIQLENGQKIWTDISLK